MTQLGLSHDVCVCVFVRACTYIYTYIYARAFVRPCAYMCVCVCASLRAYEYIYISYLSRRNHDVQMKVKYKVCLPEK